MPTHKACDRCRRIRRRCIKEPGQAVCNSCFNAKDMKAVCHFSEFSRRSNHHPAQGRSHKKKRAGLSKDNVVVFEEALVKTREGASGQTPFGVLMPESAPALAPAPATAEVPESNAGEDEGEVDPVFRASDQSDSSYIADEVPEENILDVALKMRHGKSWISSRMESVLSFGGEKKQVDSCPDKQNELSIAETWNVLDEVLKFEVEAAAAHDELHALDPGTIFDETRGNNAGDLASYGLSDLPPPSKGIPGLYQDSSLFALEEQISNLSQRMRHYLDNKLPLLFGLGYPHATLSTACYSTPPPEAEDVSIDEAFTLSQETVDVTKEFIKLLGKRQLLESLSAELWPNSEHSTSTTDTPESLESQVELSSLQNLLSCIHRMIDIWEIVLLHVRNALEPNRQIPTRYNGTFNIATTTNVYAEGFMPSIANIPNLRVHLGLVLSYTADVRDAARVLSNEVRKRPMQAPVDNAVDPSAVFSSAAAVGTSGSASHSFDLLAVHASSDVLGRAVAAADQAEVVNRMVEQVGGGKQVSENQNQNPQGH